MQWAKWRTSSDRRQSRRNLQSVEQLEARNLLAGDMVANFRADSLNDQIDDGQPVAAWMDEVSGASAAQIGSPILVRGALSGRSVVRFDATDGDDGFRLAAENSPLGGIGDFSVTVAFMTSATQVGTSNTWFENTGLVDANRLGFGKDWGLSINSSGQLTAGLGVGLLSPSSTLTSSDSNLADGNLHFATLTRSGGDLAIYVDGNAPSTLSGANSAPRDAIDVVIGSLQSGGAGKGFTGDIAEVRLFNGALDNAEVSSLHSELNSYYVNIAPTASDDAYSFTEDPQFGFSTEPAATGVLANDSDAESNELTAILVSGPAQGIVTLNADGGFLYDPPNDFFGTDSFTYQAYDGQFSNIATVTLTVENVYDPVTAVGERYKTLPGQDLNLPGLVGVLSNDQNPDRADMRAVLVDDVSNGTLSLREDGGFTYNSGGFAGLATFGYKVFDGTGDSNTATVEIMVNTPPVSVADSFSVAEDTTLSLSVAQGVTANDIDAENNNLIVTQMSDVTNGSLVLDEDGSLTYTPNENFFGEDSFSYMVSDGEDASGVVSATIQVSPVNDAPVTGADLFVTLEGNAISADAARGVLRNDSDIEGQAITATLANGPTNGSLVLNSDGSFSYTANAGFQGVDSFTYIANDGQDNSIATEALLYVGTSPLLISEFLVSNTESETRVRDDAGRNFRGDPLTPDWIEVYNPTPAALDIAGYHLTDSSNNPTKWAFPDGTVVESGGRMVVYASRLEISDPDLDETGRIHTNFKLQPEGEYLALTSPAGSVLHEYGPEYPRQRPDVSYGLNSAGEPSYFKSSTPGEANTDEVYLGIVDDTSFSIDRGYYTEPFEVEITTTEEGGQIWYTLDGSTPSPENGTMYTDQMVTISGTTNLRAAVFKEGYLPSLTDSQTYLFLDQVLQQSAEGIQSAPWGDNGPDWEMDPEIVNHADPAIRATVEDLRSIPTVSLSTDWDLFFGNKGIYPWDPANDIGVARDNHEIPTSFEFFDTSGRSTQIYSTVQVVGGSSPDRNGNDWKTDKLSMRVRFTEDVGRSSLDYPVFDSDATDSFSTLVVDARLNNVWSYSGGSEPSNQRGRAQYLRDSFASDMQLALGGYGAHGHHVHVYINGVYWGLHTLHERPDDNFAASYLGGDNDDYDVIKHTANTVVAGTNDSFTELTSGLGTRGDLTDEQWELAKSRLHVDEFINYMLLNYYGANSDWDHHNWYASSNRADGKWRFHSWDAEKVINGSAISASSALRADQTGNNNRNAPSGIHRRLVTHPEYLVRFQDAVQKQFFNDGVLTPENAHALYASRAATIDGAIRAESARWGDNQRSTPYTRQDWVNVRDDIYENYFPERTATVVSQFVRRDWYVEGLAPIFSVNGATQHGGYTAPGGSLTMTAPAGTIYYTLDGSDPRIEGGEVAAGAQTYSADIAINSSMTVMARLQMADGTWSPLSEATYITSTPADGSSLRISELHYHPADASDAEVAAGHDDADEFEFLELLNVSDQTINLTNVQLERLVERDEIRGVAFDFAEAAITELAPGGRVVVVENREAFETRYGNGLPVAGEWSGKLGNASETIRLVASGTTIHEFTYDDEWHPATDGTGFSLESVDPAAADLTVWNTKDGWRASSTPGGSPGAADGPVAGDSNGDGVFDSGDLVVVFQAGEYEDAIAGNSTFEEGDWNGDGDFTSRDLVFVFQIGNYVQAAIPVVFAGNIGAALNRVSLDNVEIDRSNRQNEKVLDEAGNRAAVLEVQTRDAIFEQFAMNERADDALSTELDDGAFVA